MTTKRRWVWAVSGVAAFVIVFAILFATAVPFTSDTLRHRMVEYLEGRLDSDVELGELHVRVFPALHAEGNGLTIRKRNQPDYPPLISIESFTVDASLMGLRRKHVSHVTLVGLEIQIPPKDRTEEDGSKGSNGSEGARGSEHPDDDIVIDTLESNDARVVIIPRKREKTPRVWAIHTLLMHNVGVGQSMPFDATLTNGVPPGEIVTNGHFGPWQQDDPGVTPIDGRFTFKDADLSVFKGISGTLASNGTFAGSLERLDVNGDTLTPDFTLRISGHPFALHAKYHSIIDATNGDTYLERIDAQFLKSKLLAKGAVLDGPPGVHGRSVSLDVTMDQARIEDIMVMAVKAATPPMTGALKLKTKFLLPPGEADVPDRLQLDGRFSIATARFMNYNVQGKINELSHRSRGRAPDAAKDSVASDFRGQFKLADGRLSLSGLSFAVPGAQVQLAGQYALRAETLDFHGTLLMNAKISETQTGVKSVLLKVVDPLFRRAGGGSAIPIKITGPRSAPSFGLEAGRVFKRDKK